MKKIIILLLLFTGISKIYAQEIPVHLSSHSIYDFVDELSTLKLIHINTAIKPYSDTFIFSCLKKAKANAGQLSVRQRKELARYLTVFRYVENGVAYKLKRPLLPQYFKSFKINLQPLGIFYQDSSFFLSLKPIWGIDYYKNNKNGFYHRWGGAALKMRMGQHIGIFANLRDNKEQELLSGENILTRRTGANYKGGGEYSEMRGGISYSWNGGSLSLVKDHLSWGTNYNGANILSDRPPSYAQLKLQLKPVDWFEFNYLHGWLVSNVIDSSRSYWTDNGLRRDVMHPKYIAANMFSFMPFEHIYFSFGNSIIYSDMNPHPAYLIPFMFFKSVDHWLNSTDGAGSYVGQNSQMFVNLSVLKIKYLHLYGSLFIDEFKMSRIRDPETHNFWSYKLGMKIADKFVKDLSVRLEYTRTSPGSYQHNINTTTFESNDYNLGHYLRDNADELYLGLSYKPFVGLNCKLTYSIARKGPSYPYVDGNDAVTHSFMEEVRWQNNKFDLSLWYELMYNTYVHFGYQYNYATGDDLTLYTAEYYQGKNHGFILGFNMGY